MSGAAPLEIRCYKAGGVLAGFMSHLLLDEIYAVEWKGGRWRFKKSFGTALKIWGDDAWANFSTYAILIIVAMMILIIVVSVTAVVFFFKTYQKENRENAMRIQAKLFILLLVIGLIPLAALSWRSEKAMQSE